MNETLSKLTFAIKTFHQQTDMSGTNTTNTENECTVPPQGHNHPQDRFYETTARVYLNLSRNSLFGKQLMEAYHKSGVC